MWAAAAGQSLDQAYSYSEGWKHLKNSALSVDAKYWIEYGYNKYLEFENSNLFDTLTHP
jgi:hypothetical protein